MALSLWALPDRLFRREVARALEEEIAPRPRAHVPTVEFGVDLASRIDDAVVATVRYDNTVLQVAEPVHTCTDPGHTHTGTTAADMSLAMNELLYGDGNVNMTAVMQGLQRDINETLSRQMMAMEPREHYDAERYMRALEQRKRADDKGMALLKNWLSPEQLKSYEENKYFEVIGGITGKRYRIAHGTVQNVYALDAKGKPKHGLCFAPKGDLVAGDVMLAQKLALECNEYAALGVANEFAAEGFNQHSGWWIVDHYIGRYDGVIIRDDVVA